MQGAASLNDALARMLDRINGDQTMQGVYRSLGMTPPEPIQSARWETVQPEQMGLNRGTLIELAQPPIGKPGTYVSGGRIEVEKNTRLKPYQARGSVSRPGTNEEVYRSEPVVFESVNQLSTLVCSATYEPHIPDGLPADVVAEIERQHRAIRYVLLRDDFLINASSFIKHGFAFFEVLWHLDAPTVAGLEFREQSTVHRWLFDDRQANWVATEFRVGGDSAGESYTIPNGRSIRTARSLLVNLHAQGNNLEGVSPVRVVTGMRMLKKAIMEMSGVGMQKYMVPIAVIAHEVIDASATILGQVGKGEHKDEVQELIDRIEALKGRIGGVLPVPAGRKLEFANPSNDMPDVIPLLTYLDTMMGLAFSNEGALLGNQSFGSYAMSQTSLERFRASAPAYAGRVAAALTKLLHIGLELNGHNPAEWDNFPVYTFRFNGTQDASKWLADLTTVMGANPAKWTDELRATAAAKLGLPSDAFDGVDDGLDGLDVTTTPDGASDDVAKTALNGAQVTSMVEVLGQVAAGLLPAESAIRILMRAFQMTREEATAMVNPADGFEQDVPDTPAPAPFPTRSRALPPDIEEEE